MPNILIVCTANRCRSPMAMTLLRHLLATNSTLSGGDPSYPEWHVTSAGTWAAGGLPAMPHSVAVMQEWGLDVRDHSSRNVTADIVNRQDLILVMETGHREALCVEFPAHAARIFLVSEMSGPRFDIKDPVYGTIADYRSTAHLLHALLSEGLTKIQAYATELSSA